MSTEAMLLARLVGSPFTKGPFWAERPQLALFHGRQAYILRDRGMFPFAGEPVHATLRFAAGDFDRMAAGEAATAASWTLGPLSAPDRKKQAFAVLALAGLGWCGRWPDPAADPEHVRLTRSAHYDLRVGPADQLVPLFPPGGPLDVPVRLTHSVRGTELVTHGLSETAGLVEISALAPARAEFTVALPALRAAALWSAEFGGLPPNATVSTRTLRSRPDPRFPEGLPLPHRHTWLMAVELER